MLDAGLVGCLRVTGRFSQNAMTKSVYDQEINSFHCPVAGARRFPIEGNSPATHSTPVLPDSARGSAGEKRMSMRQRASTKRQIEITATH
jgi:hypothetical protein